MGGGGQLPQSNALVTPHNGHYEFTVEQGGNASDNLTLRLDSDGVNSHHAAKLREAITSDLKITLAETALQTESTLFAEYNAPVHDDVTYSLGALTSDSIPVGRYTAIIDFEGDESLSDPGSDPSPVGPRVLENSVSIDAEHWSNSIENWVDGNLVVRDELTDERMRETSDSAKFNFDSENPQNNKIRLEDEDGNLTDCTTTGQGYLEGRVGDYQDGDDGFEDRVGCVLPLLDEGTYTVRITNDDWQTYAIGGTIVYARKYFDNADDEGNAELALQRRIVAGEEMLSGEVKILRDLRCFTGSDPDANKCGDVGEGIGDYRVKKTAASSVIMIQNLAYRPQSSDFYAGTQIQDMTDSENATDLGKAQFYRLNEAEATLEDGSRGADHPEFGYLYDWCTAVGDKISADCGTANALVNGSVTSSISPKGWGLPSGGNNVTVGEGADAVTTYTNLSALYHAANDAARLNPVYAPEEDDFNNNTAIDNWLPGSVWQGVLAGGYGSDGVNQALGWQGVEGNYWSSTAHELIDKGDGKGNVPRAYQLYINERTRALGPGKHGDCDTKDDEFSIRSILIIPKAVQTPDPGIEDGTPLNPQLELGGDGNPTGNILNENGFKTRVTGGAGSGDYLLSSTTADVCEIDGANGGILRVDVEDVNVDILIKLKKEGTCTLSVFKVGDWQYNLSNTVTKNFTIYKVQFAGLDGANPSTFESKYVLRSPLKVNNGFAVVSNFQLPQTLPTKTDWFFEGWSYGAPDGRIFTNSTGKFNINLPVSQQSGSSESKTVTITAKWDQHILSSDNSSWSNPLVNWAGGDLIIDVTHTSLGTASATAAQNKIKIGGDATSGGTACTTTGAGTIGDKVGCVLPSMTAGAYPVWLTTNGTVPYTQVGTIIYQKTAFTTKENIKQGEVQILTDTRTDGAGVSNKEYRVKCFNTDCWMIDNFAYQPTTEDLPSIQVIEGTDSANTASVFTTPQVIITPTSLGTKLKPEHGFLYNICVAFKDSSSDCVNSFGHFGSGNWAGDTILPTNWKVPTGGLGSQFADLSNAMVAKANANNPVYSATAEKNFRNDAYARAGTGYNDAPWLGVYSGRYGGGLSGQGSYGYYWSSTARVGGTLYFLYFDLGGVDPVDYNNKTVVVALRGVL